ncbi:MAG: DUF1549 domain-containing protein, partial [Planctomycetaceae bacterium]|nr:DUF1549 domain-containing protein [Planctomycetaceae bacterium]
MLRSIIVVSVVWTHIASTFADQPQSSSRTSAAGVASEVDRLLEQSFVDQQVDPAPLSRDEDFLRRIYLDLAGTIPTAQEVTYFGFDSTADKRSAMVDRLLESEDFSTNWGAYLREVVFSRATETRARAAQGSFEKWLVEQLRENQGWDQITSDILTATGDVQEEGAAAFIFAHTGQPAELAGEVSRIFLGIQIQCANCHDHPYDDWKREQFHELAAFFP